MNRFANEWRVKLMLFDARCLLGICRSHLRNELPMEGGFGVVIVDEKW